VHPCGISRQRGVVLVDRMAGDVRFKLKGWRVTLAGDRPHPEAPVHPRGIGEQRGEVQVGAAAEGRGTHTYHIRGCHGGQVESLVPPSTRGRLSLTSGDAVDVKRRRS
jgi:hypothetical protein